MSINYSLTTPAGATSAPQPNVPQPQLPDKPQVRQAESTAAFHDDSHNDNATYIDYGVIALAVAGPAGTAPEVINVHAPVARRIQSFDSTRNVQRPILPSPTPNQGETLATQMICPASPSMWGEGAPIFRTVGRYEFIITSLPKPTGPFGCGVGSFDQNTATVYSVQPGDFDSSLNPSST